MIFLFIIFSIQKYLSASFNIRSVCENGSSCYMVPKSWLACAAKFLSNISHSSRQYSNEFPKVDSSMFCLHRKLAMDPFRDEFQSKFQFVEIRDFQTLELNKLFSGCEVSFAQICFQINLSKKGDSRNRTFTSDFKYNCYPEVCADCSRYVRNSLLCLIFAELRSQVNLCEHVLPK